jgi:hypothetical protein
MTKEKLRFIENMIIDYGTIRANKSRIACTSMYGFDSPDYKKSLKEEKKMLKEIMKSIKEA